MPMILKAQIAGAGQVFDDTEFVFGAIGPLTFFSEVVAVDFSHLFTVHGDADLRTLAGDFQMVPLAVALAHVFAGFA